MNFWLYFTAFVGEVVASAEPILGSLSIGPVAVSMSINPVLFGYDRSRKHSR